MGEVVKLSEVDLAEYFARMAREAEERGEPHNAHVDAWKAHKAREHEWLSAYGECAPVAVAKTAWEGFRRTHAVETVERWIAGGCEKHLVLRGGVGVGKTLAACVAVRAWTEPQRSAYGVGRASRDVVWLRPDKLVSAVLHDYDESAPKLRQKIVLDDVGRETKADFAEALCTILDSGNHTLLITTNLTRQQMRERYDARLIDRLNESAIAVDLKGESMRSKAGGF